MIVIDVGCKAYGGDESIPYLIDEFHPELVVGLDPAVKAQRSYSLGEATVIEMPVAAWKYDGLIGFTVAGLRGHIDGSGPYVECCDLATLIYNHSAEGQNEIVLKMDAEGAEYDLLPHLIERGADRVLKLAWVEYHCRFCGRGGGREINHMGSCVEPPHEVAFEIDRLEASMRCEMHRWNR